MAKIVSISLNDSLLEDIDNLQKSMGFSGRSEIVRSGIKALLDDMREKEKMKGHVECVLILAHDKNFEDMFIKVKHKHEEIISTQVHNNLCNDKCLEVFVLHGSAEKIKDFFSEVRKSKHADYIKLIVP